MPVTKELELKWQMLRLHLDIMVKDMLGDATLKQSLLRTVSHDSFYWFWRKDV